MKPLFILFLNLGLLTHLLGQGIITSPGGTSAFPRKADNVTALVGAFADEVELLRSQIQDRQDREIEGLQFSTGTLDGRPVVLVRAGIGKVNAAMTTTLLLEHFRPREVVFTGIAGGMNPALQPGDLVIGTRLVHHDFGRQMPQGFVRRPTQNPYTFAENPVFFPSDSDLVRLASAVADTLRLELVNDRRKPRVAAGVIVTGDVFMASTTHNRQIRAETGGEAVEMEGAAVAQLCHQQGVPVLVIRSLSDSGDDAAVGDIQRFYQLAARNSAALVRAVVGRLPK